MNNNDATTRGMKNCRYSRLFKGCSPLRLLCNLTRKCHAAGYYSYTNRWLHTKKSNVSLTKIISVAKSFGRGKVLTVHSDKTL